MVVVVLLFVEFSAYFYE